MNHRVSAPRGALAAVIAVAALAPLPATGQTVADATPRTVWGAPDLQGIWDFRTITPLERPSELAAQEFLSDEEAAALEARIAQERIERDSRKDFFAYNEFWLDQGTKVIDSRRTSLIVDPSDGKIPPLTPGGQKQAEARRAYAREHPADSWVDRPLEERCLLGLNAGPPIVPRGYNQNVRLLQNPGYAVILSEMIHDARIVPLDGRPHIDRAIRQWAGDSRGHWEGETLVVDTTNFTEKTRFRGSTANLHLVERFTRVDANTILYEFTVDDPTTWTRPWSAALTMAKTQAPMYEYACHEGNHAMVGILAGARAEEKAAAEAAGSR
jgi:hypothetical protein